MRHVRSTRQKYRLISFAKATGTIATLTLATLASNSYAFTMSSPTNGVQLFDPLVTSQAYNPIPGAILGRGYDTDSESLQADCLVVGGRTETLVDPIPTGGGGEEA